MKRGWAMVLLGVLLAPPGAAAGPVPSRLLPLLDSSLDRVVRSAPLPSPERPQAEVRLIRRGRAAVMQTVIHSRAMWQVVGAIRTKEESAWPEGRQGHDDSQRYVEALVWASRQAPERKEPSSTGSSRLRSLAIEFVLAPKESFVAFLAPEVEVSGGRFRLLSRRPISVLPLSRDYVRGNLYEIARDALRLDKTEAEAAIGPLLPPESPPATSHGTQPEGAGNPPRRLAHR